MMFTCVFNQFACFIVDVKRLFNARQHEAETEDHLKMLDERTVGRLKQDLIRLENDLTDTKDRKSGLAVSRDTCRSLVRSSCVFHRLSRMKFFVAIKLSTK
jgi:hypothetical protein